MISSALPAVSKGDEVPILQATISEVGLAMYGAATWDWYRAHYDQNYARQIGFGDIYVDGQQWGAYFARQLVDWLGPKVFIRSMKLGFKSMVFCGEKVHAFGTVEDVERSESGLTLRIHQEMLSGERSVATAYTMVSIAPVI